MRYFRYVARIFKVVKLTRRMIPQTAVAPVVNLVFIEIWIANRDDNARPCTSDPQIITAIGIGAKKKSLMRYVINDVTNTTTKIPTILRREMTK